MTGLDESQGVNPNSLPQGGEGARRGTLVWILAALVLGATPTAGIDGSSYACRPLADALRDLQARGLAVVFGSNLVRDGMLVSKVPAASDPRRLLDQLLEPHGLRAQEGAGGRLLVVQSFSGASSVPPWSWPQDETLSGPVTREIDGVLPAWVEDTSPALTVIDVPGTAGTAISVAVSPTSRYLVLRLAPEVVVSDWTRLAFDLKALIVAARSRAEARQESNLKVALEASPEATNRLLDHGLGPYLDAYAGARLATVPAADPTARRWWRPPADGGRPLHTLLRGGAWGVELVILDRPLDSSHRAFLERIQATPSVDLEHQPAVRGLAADRVRFLYGLETGSYYLAAYAGPGRQTLSFSLGGRVEARGLYPRATAVPAVQIGGRTELELAGDHPFHLVELRPAVPKVENGVLRVDGEDFVDPYEVVVRNQVFQEREARKVRSLDVMERRHSVLQNRSARRYTWTHRIIERPGRLTEFHHLGVERNGVPFPERKLRVGRDFRAEAQVELDPLEIELDRTYAYRYLGEETIDGHATWKIGFEPLQAGAYLTGTVWIDRRTHAHRKLQIAHAGLSGPLISRQVTRFFDWVPDDDQCFWNWSRSEGLSVIESPTSQLALAIDAERYGFDYNRDDIEHQVRIAHASDVPIHVATPPDGHRWLVREEPKKKRRRLLRRLFHRRDRQTAPEEGNRNVTGALAELAFQGPPEAGPPQHRISDRLGEPNVSLPPAGEEPFGGRVLADRNAYTSVWDAFVIARENCSNTISCSGLGVDYRRTDLGKNRSELYAGLYDIQSFASFTYPRLQGSCWVMTASMLHDISYWENAVLHPGTTGVWAEFEERRTGLSFTFARPISTTLRARATFGLTHLRLRPDPWVVTPGLSLPSSVFERLGAVGIDFQRRKLYSQVSFELRQRNDSDPWGIDGSEPLSRAPSRLTLLAGYSTALAKDRSLGTRVVLQKGWNLDHFSDFFSGFSDVRAPGFQPQRHDLGLGASINWSGRLAPRLPVTLRLEGAALRSERYRHDDADQLGIEVETFFSAWFKTDLFLRLGFGLYSNIPDQDGDLRTRFIVSRKF